jgi:perosamine synthetase
MIHQIEPYVTNEDIEAVTTYMQTGGWLTEFKKTETFERNLAAVLGVPYVITCTSGTVGLYLALLALGIGKGHKVLVPNYTMIATINAVLWAGAEPVLVDIEPDTLCMDISKIDCSATYSAMMYVSINGRSTGIVPALQFCKEHNIRLIEDACQSFGSKLGAFPLGTFGEVGVFSLTPHKIITTGQGGFIATNSKKIHDKLRKLKDFGRVAPGVDLHDSLGFNFKFTDIQAALGISQLHILDKRLSKKMKIYNSYRTALATYPISFFEHSSGSVPWFVEILTKSPEARHALINYLKKKRIGTRRFYPPLSSQKIFAQYGKFPISEDISYRGVWLPSSVSLEKEQVNYVCDTIKEFFDG